MDKENSKIKKIKKIILTILAILVVGWCVYDFTPIIKVPLANKIYGTSKCTKYNSKYSTNFLMYADREHPIMGGCAITHWKCELCFRRGESSTTVTPKLCTLCSDITNRCKMCGKLLEKE